MSKYNLETKLASVKAYLNGVDSFKTTAQNRSVSKTMLKKWVAKFKEHGLSALQHAIYKLFV